MAIDEERWRRIVFESLRSVQSDAPFQISVDELDFGDLGGAQPEQFPFDELAEFVESWLASLEPDGGDFRTDWIGGGVRIVICARGSPGR